MSAALSEASAALAMNPSASHHRIWPGHDFLSI